MSDSEVEGDNRGEEDLQSSLLIQIVRQNPALYAKNKREYSGKGFSKYLAWDGVGKVCDPPLSGPAAEKLFYKIRQKFGKELRKVQSSQKGKSGQGATAPYVSQWVHFEDCMFLRDHIAARKTSSSFTQSSSIHSGSHPTPSPSPSPTLLSPSSVWSTDLQSICTSGDDSSSATNSSTRERSTVISPPPTRPCSAPPIPQPSVASSSSNEDVTATVLQAIQSAPLYAKKAVPESDTFSRKRKKGDDVFMKMMMEQSQTLTNVVAQVGESLKVPVQTVGSMHASTNSDPIMGAIGFALDKVPADRRLQCMLDVLTLINNKYVSEQG